MEKLDAAAIAHQFIRNHIQPGNTCVDCTAGNGWDTLFLKNLTGNNGFVYAFDIQPNAIEKTSQRLTQAGYITNVAMILDSHENLLQYVPAGGVDCIIFNLGWLPGESHDVKTTAETTVLALEASIAALKSGGLLSITAYRGKDSGYDEFNAVSDWAKNLHHHHTVIKSSFYNRHKDPPEVYTIVKK